MEGDSPAALTASEAARLMREGALTSEDLVGSCLERIRQVEPVVQAWTYLDEGSALEQARAADELRRSGRFPGALCGVPVGIKDIIDTGDMPTENGTPLHKGRTPRADASVVARLRAAGAVIMGKTVTTECAYFHPGKTCNPHNPEHTPGGSSSGSAAAVAASMVPLALGSQTNGSVIRPASFCGVYGFKPTHGLIPRTGILKLSRTLDHVGVFARSIDDVALVAETLVGSDVDDPDTRPRAAIPFRELAAQEPPLPPLLGFVKPPVWDRAAPETKEAFRELAAQMSESIVEIELPASTAGMLDWHRTIMEAEMAANLDREYEQGRERLSESLRSQLARGREIRALDYQRAVARIGLLNAAFDEIFERCDAFVTPSAAGTAPRGLESTGDPSFCTLWTFCGMPAVNLPLMQGENGLPL